MKTFFRFFGTALLCCYFLLLCIEIGLGHSGWGTLTLNKVITTANTWTVAQTFSENVTVNDSLGLNVTAQDVLHVNGELRIDNNHKLGWEGTTDNMRWVMYLDDNLDLYISTPSSRDIKFGEDSGAKTVQGTLNMEINADGGVIVGSPTGGSQGAGTVNAVGLYDDGVIVADAVFEPDYTQLNIAEMEKFYKENKHLPTIKGRADWEKRRYSIGELSTMLWVTVEVQAKYIAELNKRLKALEKK